MGGKDTPACGGALGVERIVEAMKKKATKQEAPFSPSDRRIFLAQLGGLAKRKSLKIFEEFRKARIPIGESFGKDSLKTQLRIADKIGANYTLIFGQKEALEGTIIIRDMKNGKQETVKLEKVVDNMKRKLKK